MPTAASTRPAVAQRKATNVTLDAILLAEAKALRINVSQAAEAGVAQAVATKRQELWLAANREALESSNAYVEQNGLPLAHHRHF
ncbi:type II toxin-antitoxin system CcdA family antitoxin [Aquabacterium sp.]|uniref:type II toxin-antitoxin system CcdA family antitoxin n=1 Tax=Aquabacterium sp. TaxID=1872578 RepID=UPI0019AE361D|nr:type II toxin-antitoxin system CcdA family antitoxin [Aquabacterium sp.]MBC7699671.1 type II toxin-antitoxin system CcdA family antitoxin [Aquabacterium sp.]